MKNFIANKQNSRSNSNIFTERKVREKVEKQNKIFFKANKMYKSKRIKRVEPAAKPSQPVFASQKRNEAAAAAEKENAKNNVEDPIIPSSQDQDVPPSQNASQSRFASQRHQIRLTQGQQQARGRNYFEIALISTKIQVTDNGK